MRETPRRHDWKRDKTHGLMVAYFFFGHATLDNLEPRFLATVLVPLGEATVRRDSRAPEGEGGLNSALAVAAVCGFFFGWPLSESSGLASKWAACARLRSTWVSSTCSGPSPYVSSSASSSSDSQGLSDSFSFPFAGSLLLERVPILAAVP